MTARTAGSGYPRWARAIPNTLTVARLIALPVLLVMLATAAGPTSTSAGVLFGVVAATDFLDGTLARRMHAESAFGRLVDPLADRLLVAVGLVGLILMDRIHWTAPAILIMRDLLLVLGFVLLARSGVLVRVDMAGKASSALAMFATGGCLIFAGTWVEVLMWLAVVFSLATLIHYVIRGRRMLAAMRGSISA